MSVRRSEHFIHRESHSFILPTFPSAHDLWPVKEINEWKRKIRNGNSIRHAASDPGSCFFMILFLFSLPLSTAPTSQMQEFMFIDRTESCLRNSHCHVCRHKQVNRQTHPSACCFLLFHSFCYHQAPHFALPLVSATLHPGTCQKLPSLNLTSPSPLLPPAVLTIIFFFFSPLHVFSQADHHLHNNVKHTEGL